MAVDLAIRWAVEYGKHYVNVFNLLAPGLAAGISENEADQLCLNFARQQVEASPDWVVDTVELRATSQRGVWDLD